MTGCPDPVRLVAASCGEDVAALAHAAGCPACRRAMRDHLALRELAQELPTTLAPRGRRDERCAELLAYAEDVVVARPLAPAVIVEPWARARRAARGVAVAAAGLAAAAALVAGRDRSAPIAAVPIVAATSPDPAAVAVVVNDTTPPDPAPMRAGAAVVSAGAGARYDRRDDGSFDRIALRDGTLTIEATPETVPVLISGKNARIRTGGARLAAHAEAGVVRQVQVFAGSVEIRTGSRVVEVSAGETWTWDAATAGEDRAADPAAARVAAFRAGWDALRAGEFAAAAAQLERAEADRGVGEDATYWAAIAWGRAGEPAKARAGLARFLARFPNATRAGEAHLALARLLDDPALVRTHLEAAAGDADPRVRAAAAAALDRP